MRRAPDELARIDRLFDGALSLSLEDRQTFLDRLDRTEPLLAADVRALLAAAERPEGTALWEAAIDNEWEAIAPGSGLLDDLNAGERIGPYRIVRLLGCGGMAPVYLAERADGVFSQQVALKLIPRDLLSADAVNRFTRERQILAHLNHANIARLFDGGVDDRGRSYIAMEFVDGEPIDRYCDDRRLTIESRLSVFAQAADAVQYAHRNLVIHRDLKPSNILVTREGRSSCSTSASPSCGRRDPRTRKPCSRRGRCSACSRPATRVPSSSATPSSRQHQTSISSGYSFTNC